jgi:copper(I)-binding protein
MPAAPKVIFSHATMTAASSAGYSALTMHVHNASNTGITLLRVTGSSSGMMFFSSPSLLGTHPMHYLPTITIGSGKSLTLGYQHDGVMLSGTTKQRIGTRVPLTIQWTTPLGKDFSTTLAFRVVAAPPHLSFRMN